MFKPEDEMCANCARYLYGNRKDNEGYEPCKAYNTMFSFQPGPVPCVHFIKEPETKIVYYDKHIWDYASTNFAHMNGVSWIGWCKRCGAEGSTGGAEHNCHKRQITKRYKVGGTYRKSCSPEWLKQNMI